MHLRRLCLVLITLSCAWAASGPDKGSLVVVGGGQVGPEIAERFVKLAGGPNARIVVIPTADDRENPPDVKPEFLVKAGAGQITILHTRDRKVADSEEFVKPLLTATAVWFPGGRQWRLVDAYAGTRTECEIRNVLRRNGVIGGSSAGATIQGSYLVRGAREGNTVMMAPGYEKGFGYLAGVAVDQHLIKRKREKDLLEVIERYPGLLGIGIDESTAIVVRHNRFEVIGASKVAIYDVNFRPGPDGVRYFWLEHGDRYDLKKRRKL